MDEISSNSLQMTIGSLRSTVNLLKESVDKQEKRFDAFAKTLHNIEEKLEDKLEESLKIAVENSYQLKIQKTEIDNVKDDVNRIKQQMQDEKNRRNRWWDSLTNKIIGTIFVAVILSVAAFYAGEYKQTLKYQTPPNHVTEQSN